jgi:hypothetical protein
VACCAVHFFIECMNLLQAIQSGPVYTLHTSTTSARIRLNIYLLCLNLELAVAPNVSFNRQKKRLLSLNKHYEKVHVSVRSHCPGYAFCFYGF